MKGTVSSWKDEKGFGFIDPEGGTGQVFFHISSFKQASRKPQVGDIVMFDVAKDSQGRLKAKHVLLEGVLLARAGGSGRVVTEPVRKDALDYIAYGGLALLLAISLGLFIKTGAPESALVPAAVFIALVFFLLVRKKRPANKLFSCSKCRSVATHDQRTVLAWNRGFARLYCRSCHHAWLREQPKDRQGGSSAYASPRSGCLGLFLVMASAPIICVIGAVTWIV